MNDTSAASGVASHTQYRSDIDGLRAVAVIPVVAFHAGIGAIGGGYVGVDVFFVISGYLITGIIWSEIGRNRFSLVNFYERRIRRIFPALLAMIVLVLVGTSAVFLPTDFSAVPKTIWATLGFVSNLLFWQQVDYFDEIGKIKPLLHTWSLAVEEQYYLIVPLILMVIFRYFRSYVVHLIWAMTIISFALSVVLVFVVPSFTFYMLPTRMWELLAGSLLALRAVPEVRNKTLREAFAALGLLAILAACFLYTESMPFPGAAALLPVVGAALIIHTAQGTAIGKALSVRPMVFVGLISYSLYLFHWPIIVFLEYSRQAPAEVADIALALFLSFGAAILSWRFVERPFRAPKSAASHIPRKRIFLYAGAASLALAGTSAAATLSDGWKSRFSDQVVQLDGHKKAFSPRRAECHRNNLAIAVEKACVYGAPVAPSIALWGDSHGVELAATLGELAQSHNVALQQFTFSGCSPALGFKDNSADCETFSVKVAEYLQAHPNLKTVIWVSRMDAEHRRNPQFLVAAKKTIEQLRDSGKTVVILYPIPSQPMNIPRALGVMQARGINFAEYGANKSEFMIRNGPGLAMLDSISGQGIYRVMPHKLMCDARICHASKDGVPLYFDDFHLSMPGARYVAGQFSALPIWSQKAN